MNPSNVSPPNPGTNQPNAPAMSGSSASGTAGGIKDTAREKAQQLKEAAAETAQQAAQQAKDRAAQAVGEKRDEVADRIGGYSSAVRESARSLEDQDPNIAWFTSQAADRLQGVADYVRNRDFNDLRRDAEDFGRRHPAILLGGLFLAGFIVGGAIKAGRRAASQEEQTDFEYGYDPETSPGEAMSTPVSAVSPSSEI